MRREEDDGCCRRYLMTASEERVMCLRVLVVGRGGGKGFKGGESPEEGCGCVDAEERRQREGGTSGG